MEFFINLNDILGHDFAIILSNIFIAVRNEIIYCERSNDNKKWNICPAKKFINDVDSKDENCQKGITFYTNGSHVMVKGMCGGQFTVYYHGKMI